jgi:4-hydroxybenzoate polyprenyltransferase
MIFEDIIDKLRSFSSTIRYRDAFIFQSPAIAGMLMFFPNVSPTTGLQALLLAVGSFLLMAYIFVFNDWADFHSDRLVLPNNRHTLVDNKAITHREMLILAVFLALIGTLTVVLVLTTLIPIVVLIIIFGLLYSLPIRGLQGKGIPVFSSFLHFAGILLTFLLGATMFAPIGMPAIMVGSYFGILITAGHLVQEVQDYNEDNFNHIQTNAVWFGQKPVFIVSFIMFGISFIVLYSLAQAGLTPGIIKYAVLLFPIYAVWAFRVYRSGLQSESVRDLRNRYRILFAGIIFFMVSGILANKLSW